MSNDFLNTTHGNIGCRTCHGGENVLSFDDAHEGMVKPGSAAWNDADLTFGICEQCHEDESELYANSLHYTQNGFQTTFANLTHEGVMSEEGAIQFTWDVNCSSCHAECGECHVSRPRAQKGGLLSAHMFEKEPPMEETCVGCHSTRNGAEFMGKMGPTSDIHYYDYDMVCTDCHEVSNFHGTGELAVDMHAVEELPKCIDCHQDDMTQEKGIKMHLVHEPDLLECTVCHSTDAHGCEGCHVTYKDETKTSVTSHTEPVDTFKIAKNPNPNELLPYKYITVRHIPTTKDMLKGIGYPELEKYDEISNWQHSPTHNVQKYTLQNSECSSCHDNKKIFLTEDDVRDGDSEAVYDMLVKELPPVMK